MPKWRAARLIEQMLTLARLESGPTAAAERVELREVVRAAMAEVAGGALAKGIELSSTTPFATRSRAVASRWP